MLLPGLFLAAMLAAQTSSPVPAGTALMVRLDTTLATFSNRVGDPFQGKFTQPVMINGSTLIPVGATVEGRVTKVSEPRRISGKPSIGILPEAVILPTGERYFLDATLTDTNIRGTDVSSEGQFKGTGHDRRDKLEVGGGTAGGMLVGGLIGGGPGTLDRRRCGCDRNYRALARQTPFCDLAGRHGTYAGIESSATGQRFPGPSGERRQQVNSVETSFSTPGSTRVRCFDFAD